MMISKILLSDLAHSIVLDPTEKGAKTQREETLVQYTRLANHRQHRFPASPGKGGGGGGGLKDTCTKISLFPLLY